MKLFKDTIDIDLKSFFRKKLPNYKDDFGIYLITGYQGTGKTYFSIYLATKINNDRKIVTNIKSLHIPNKKIEYFEKIDEIVNHIEENCVFIIDEISKKYTKECKQDKLFYSWLQQSRKRKRIVLLITQEYLQCPIWLRGVARYVFTTKKSPILPIFITYRGFAVLNEETKEWTVEPDKRYIYKRNFYISKYYDTFEPINTL